MRKLKKLVLLSIFSSLCLTACSKNTDRNELSKEDTLKIIQKNLDKNDIPVKIKEIEQSPHPDFYILIAEGQPTVYATKDGKYIFPAPMINIDETPATDITEKARKQEAEKALAAVPKDELISYTAPNEKHALYIFTDVSCSFCRAFHPLVKDLNANGISVNFLAFPRGLEFRPAMESVWCSKDRKASYEKALKGEKVESEACDSPVSKHVQLGFDLNIEGTPAIFSKKGTRLPAFPTADLFLKALLPESK